MLPVFFFLMIRRPPRSTHCISSAASDVYKRQVSTQSTWVCIILLALCDDVKFINTEYCEEVVLGTIDMPELPTATKYPPLILNDESQSNGPFPLLVGPFTKTTPPVISIEPLASNPSPSALTNIQPPFNTNALDVPPAALKPSSLDFK
eukprot:TRINITY_DN15991_c0_g1_i1.p2 TRINITY_DN15991_c0_g1~~TRINITY_DN15991_c0_g1_i1.p2  ORF type:complete len:149 (-),score=24.00 TRINITY_DN15991_c0_g1_i1:312-758(-)